MSETVYTGQGIAKDCVVGDRSMNRYAIFNGLERPRKIDAALTADILGYDAPTITSVTSVADAGSLENGKWYSYKAVYASHRHLRPVAVADGSQNYTRGNPSAVSSQQSSFAASSMSVVVPRSTNTFCTYILLYRSLGKSTQAAAEAGPFYYVTQAANPGAGSATIVDGTADASVGLTVETDNYAPSAWRYAVNAFGYLFAGGNYIIGTGYTCTVTPGSSLVTLSANIAFDGIREWYFRCTADTSGGVDGSGLFYASYVNANTIRLLDSTGTAKNYDGSLNGSGKAFTLYLSGHILRWCKNQEPESWPTLNSVVLEGNISGMAMLPNLPLLVVCTDEPSMWVFDLTLIGTSSFKTSRRLLSTEYTATSHYSLVGVEGKLRGIDAHRGAIWETDGVNVTSLTRITVPKIWEYLDKNESKVKNWHCAYDEKQKLFGAFVSYRDSHRLIDFCIGQHIVSGGWFFNFEKDLLCTASYEDPVTGERMVLGGTQGLGTGQGATWGRIWSPYVYDDWIPTGTLRSGSILSATVNTVTVDVSGGTNLHTTNGGLAGRWCLVCDANGENAQLIYIYSNTADVITANTIVGSTSSTELDPVPEAGWMFFLGVIEMRWGPKRFDFDDPDKPKKVLEVHVVVDKYDSTNLPFIRMWRGLESGYAVQNPLIEATYRGGTANGGLYSRYESHGEESPRVGLAFIDRSYDRTELKSVTVVYHVIGGSDGDKRQT